MTIQIQQTFPHCERCGIMIHTRRSRIVARALDDRTVVFCTDRCRDEYAELSGLADSGDWADGATASARSRRVGS